MSDVALAAIIVIALVWFGFPDLAIGLVLVCALFELAGRWGMVP